MNTITTAITATNTIDITAEAACCAYCPDDCACCAQGCCCTGNADCDCAY